MRVTMIMLALVTTPFLARVSQAQGQSTQTHGLGHDAQHCAMRAALHPDKVINKCDPQPPPPQPQPPPPSCASTGALNLGGAAISGTVKNFTTGAPLVGWCVEIFGALSASMPTDASGNYSFTGLPDGTYSVCEDVQSGWTLKSPSPAAACPGGTFYTFGLFTPGNVAGFVNFGNTFP